MKLLARLFPELYSTPSNYYYYLLLLIVYLFVRFGGTSGSFGVTMDISARPSLAKIRTIAQTNSPDMPSKLTTVRFRVKTSTMMYSGYKVIIGLKLFWYRQICSIFFLRRLSIIVAHTLSKHLAISVLVQDSIPVSSLCPFLVKLLREVSGQGADWTHAG